MGSGSHGVLGAVVPRDFAHAHARADPDVLPPEFCHDNGNAQLGSDQLHAQDDTLLGQAARGILVEIYDGSASLLSQGQPPHVGDCVGKVCSGLPPDEAVGPRDCDADSSIKV